MSLKSESVRREQLERERRVMRLTLWVLAVGTGWLFLIGLAADVSARLGTVLP